MFTDNRLLHKKQGEQINSHKKISVKTANCVDLRRSKAMDRENWRQSNSISLTQDEIKSSEKMDDKQTSIELLQAKHADNL